MWIYDLILAVAATASVMILGVVALRRQYRLKHPPPTLDEKIKYYETLNESLRKDQEG